MQWAETESFLNEAQFGFRQGRRTTDHIFILNTVIQHYKEKKQPLFTCFVDFKKAFDSVSHNKLVETGFHWNKFQDFNATPKYVFKCHIYGGNQFRNFKLFSMHKRC